MQTKQQIERLLASAGVSPNKRLGQNFLIDLNLMRLLIDSAGIGRNDIVLEVGCGTGSFTEGLGAVAGKVIGVEFDKTLAGIARKQVAGTGNVNVINADVLESKHTICREVISALEEAKLDLDGRIILAANLPYNVATPVMVNLIVGEDVTVACDAMYVTVQKEVAERMAAGPGSKDYGILSILMEAVGEVKMLRRLAPSVFWPRPQVESAMMSFQRRSEKVGRIGNLSFFRDVVELFMGHRRKMLKACVKLATDELEKVHSWHDIFARAFVEPHRRPEELGADDYIAIANLCWEQLH